MPDGVIIRGRYVSKNRPIILVVVSLIMGVIAGVNLGIGVNYYCYGVSYDSWCNYRRNAYIISGSCFAVSAVLFLVAAISLHLKIKQAIRVTEVVVTQPDHYQQPTNVVVTPYQPTAAPLHYPAPAINTAPPVGFAAYQQVAQPVTPYGAGYGEQKPPPYSP